MSRFPSACAREALPRSALAGRDTGCKEKFTANPKFIHVTELSGIAQTKFPKIFAYHESTPIDTKGVSAKRNPFNPRNLRSNSADAETDIPDRFPAEASFQFSQDFDLGDLLELVVQGWLEHPDVENSVTQRDGR